MQRYCLQLRQLEHPESALGNESDEVRSCGTSMAAGLVRFKTYLEAILCRLGLPSACLAAESKKNKCAWLLSSMTAGWRPSCTQFRHTPQVMHLLGSWVQEAFPPVNLPLLPPPTAAAACKVCWHKHAELTKM